MSPARTGAVWEDCSIPSHLRAFVRSSVRPPVDVVVVVVVAAAVVVVNDVRNKRNQKHRSGVRNHTAHNARQTDEANLHPYHPEAANPWSSFTCVRACVRSCVRAFVRAFVRACVRACAIPAPCSFP